jgi:hypothetical protein
MAFSTSTNSFDKRDMSIDTAEKFKLDGLWPEEVDEEKEDHDSDDTEIEITEPPALAPVSFCSLFRYVAKKRFATLTRLLIAM